MFNEENRSYFDTLNPDYNYFNYVFNANSNVEVLKYYSITYFNHLSGNHHDSKLFIMGYNIRNFNASINHYFTLFLNEGSLLTF